MTQVLNHLWQSTVFAAIAGLLTLALKKNRASTRHWIWVIASLKFLIPFAAFTAIGTLVGAFWAGSPPVPARVAITATQILQPFEIPQTVTLAANPVTRPILPFALLLLWIVGFVIVLFALYVRWQRVKTIIRAASPLLDGREADVLRRLQNVIGIKRVSLVQSEGTIEPSLFGIFRPVLLLPGGIAKKLTDAQLETVLAHELCHVRRRDNLISAIHTVVEAIFWFHPLVWWLGARLIEERERACDEEVLRICAKPEAYAESILTVCRYCLESPLHCASGIGGSDLKNRIERIMSSRVAVRLNGLRKTLLALMAIAAIVIPLVIGALHPSLGRAQSQPETSARPEFDAASVKRDDPDKQSYAARKTHNPGRISYESMPLVGLVSDAYGIKMYQLQAPEWFLTERFNVTATMPPNTPNDQLPLMLQALLEDRLHLAVHWEKKDIPAYTLHVERSGPKLRESDTKDPRDPGSYSLGGTNGIELTGKMNMSQLVRYLSNQLGGPVVDQTGLKQTYDIKLNWNPALSARSSGDAAALEETGPTIFAAMREQLGLKLEPTKSSVDILVVDHADKDPTEN